jgi:hypothetical protein
VAENLGYCDQLIADVLTYCRAVALPHRTAEEPGHELDTALSTLVERLCDLQAFVGAAGVAAGATAGVTPDPEALQSLALSVSNDAGVQLWEWFRTFYRVFIK